MRILIIDDNEVESGALKKLLKRRFDAEVFEAGTMKQADMIIKANGLDMVLLDLQLPDSRIEQTLAHIKSIPYPVFVYTGFDDPSLRERVLDSGAADFIVKATGNASIIERIGHSQYKLTPDPKLLQGAYMARHDEPARLARSEWKGTIPRLAAAVMSVIMFVGGLVAGGWSMAGNQGRQNESDRLHFIKLDDAIIEMRKSNEHQDQLIRDLEEKATRSMDERAALREQWKITNDNIVEWLKRIETQVNNLSQFQNPQSPPRTTKR